MKTTFLKQTKHSIAKIAALLISIMPLTTIAGGPAYGNNNNGMGTFNSSSANNNNAKSAATRQANAILALRNDPLMQDFMPYNDTNKLSESEVDALQKIDHYLKGQSDADDNYRANKGYRRAIFLTSLIGGPIVGAIPSAVGAASAPSDNNLNMPKSELTNDDDYVKGYKHEAHYIKKHGTWGRYIVASLIWLAAANIILH